MRKICALIMTSFYLLLSTGAYACLLHCTTDYLSSRLEAKPTVHGPENEHAHDEQESDDDCDKGDCNCCYHHGTYVVKENAKIITHFVFQPVDFAITVLPREGFSFEPLIFANEVSWPRSTGPPFPRNQPLYIFNRTLLI
ncbi:hypothetical protein [Mucilaginibacter sp. 44-25]|jgi:hypothetical protein|uniref:hypothetical protein n=1 Tax=Mucilaginibacter sp. 44-25 TaxID=1895794 RepID=UPI000B16EF31|nr:hypothetical protein [Mucilaginibacter sp. 44-25]